MIKAGCKSLPVVMYHYVNDLASGTTLSPARFEEHCRSLAANGWSGISLAEAEAFLQAGEPLPAKSVLLTFDDGYLDNYLYAMPLLYKYGHKGVVFAVSDRLEPSEAPRAELHQALEGSVPVPDSVRLPQVRTSQGFVIRRDVFLNHREAHLVDSSGCLSLASHSRGHYGVCTGPEYTGFVKPGSSARTFFLTEDPLVWGMPDFAVKAGLRHRAFIPAPEMLDAVSRLVPQDFDAAAEFFARPQAETELAGLLRRFSGNSLGRYETDAERLERMWREIAGGKSELEAILGHEVRSLCWPWGEYSPEALDLARSAGFSVFFTTREGANPPGCAGAVHRFKGKDRDGRWLVSRCSVYSRPLIGALYARLRI